MTEITTKGTWFKRHTRGLTVTLAVFLLIIASLSFWITNNIYNSQRFADKVTQAVTTDGVRNSIASEITDELYKNRPVAQQLLGSRSSSFISSLLASEQFTSVFEKFAQRLNQFITSNSFEPIVIDVSGIVDPLQALVDKISPDENIQIPHPDNNQIVLLDNVDLPNFKVIGQVLLILGPLSAIGLVALAVVGWNYNKDNGFRYVSDTGIVFMISSVLLYILTYTSGALLTLGIVDPDRSQIMQSIYDIFISNLRTYILWMFIIGLVLKLVSSYKLGQFKAIAKKFAS